MPNFAALSSFPEPWWAAPNVHLYVGGARACLWRLPTRSVHCVVTSPPYWSLRDYGSGTAQIGLEEVPDCLGWATKQPCGGCYVCHIVAVFDEVRRVLRDDGTCWLNLGDTYGPRGLVGVPQRVALALQANGWAWGAALPWVKRSGMPESTQSRPGKSTEDVFMLTKGEEYYFDMDAVRPTSGRSMRNGDLWFQSVKKPWGAVGVSDEIVGLDVTSQSNGQHKKLNFATFPPRLVEPLISASTSECGACSSCGAPYRRLVTRVGGAVGNGSMDARDRSLRTNRNGLPGSGSTLDGVVPSRETLGWRPDCGCRDASVSPCVVLDPFVGSGTAVVTAVQMGRAGVGIDLSEDQLRENVVPRVEAAMGVGSDRRAVRVPRDAAPTARRLRG